MFNPYQFLAGGDDCKFAICELDIPPNIELCMNIENNLILHKTECVRITNLRQGKQVLIFLILVKVKGKM